MSPASIAEGVAASERRLGRIDGLVNNAAIMTRSNLETTDLATFDRTVAVNIRAPFLLIQAAFPHFKKQGGGRVVARWPFGTSGSPPC